MVLSGDKHTALRPHDVSAAAITFDISSARLADLG